MRKLLIIPFLVLLLAIGGCQFKGEVARESLGAYIGGTSGLEVSFLENAPPADVYDENQDEFDIALLLENKGEHDIDSNKIIASISGIRAADFNIANLNRILPTSIEGKTIRQGTEIRGGEDELIFEDAKYKHDLKADFSAEVIVHTCYQYKTNAITTVCLKRDVLKRTSAEDTCEVTNDVLKLDTSSAPVQILNTAQIPRGKSTVKLTFDVSNKGDGEVYTPTAFSNTCFGKEDQRDRIRIKVSSPADGLKIECKTLGNSADGIIKLLDGKRAVDCTIDTSSLQEITFETPIQIEASYFYRGFISQDITVLAGE